MNDTWDLSILYKGFDDPAFTGDMAALDEAIRSRLFSQRIEIGICHHR